MPDMTAQEVITSAYRKGGVQSPTTAQLASGLEDLQNMLSSWSAKGLLVPSLVSENFTLTIGQAVYTIGVTGDSPDLVTATGRPTAIIAAFIRISNTDHKVRVALTQKEYAGILQKDLTVRPTWLYYDPQYPNGTIKFNTEADVAYDFHLLSRKVLVEPSALGDTFSVPREYNRAMIYNLAIEEGIDNDIDLPPEVFAIALDSMEIVENMNANDQLKGPVELDRAITRFSPGGSLTSDFRNFIAG